MAIKICIAQNKGGNHKTTVALNMTDALKKLGYSVLLIDLDAQANASTTYGAKMLDTCTMVDVLKGECSIKEATQKTKMGDIVPGDSLLADFEFELLSEGEAPDIMANELSEIDDLYDFIIFDTPPNIGLYTKTAFSVADGVIIPTLADKYSIDGLDSLITKINRVKKIKNKKLEIYGVLLSGYNASRSMDNDVKRLLPDKLAEYNINVFDTNIRQCQDIKKALAKKDENKSLFYHYPNSAAARDYMELTKEFIKDIK